jgi:hypothetical protein
MVARPYPHKCCSYLQECIALAACMHSSKLFISHSYTTPQHHWPMVTWWIGAMSNKLNSSTGQMSIRKKIEGRRWCKQVRKHRSRRTKWRRVNWRGVLLCPTSARPDVHPKKPLSLMPMPGFLPFALCITVLLHDSLDLLNLTKLDVQFPFLFMFPCQDVGVGKRKPFSSYISS